MKIAKKKLMQIINEELQKEVNRGRQPRQQIKNPKDRIQKTSRISSELPSEEFCKKIINLAEKEYEAAGHRIKGPAHERNLENLIFSPERPAMYHDGSLENKSFPKIATKCFTLEQKRKYLFDPNYEEKDSY